MSNEYYRLFSGFSLFLLKIIFNQFILKNKQDKSG